MIKHGTKNCVLVELEKLSDNEYVLASGIKLFMDTSYKPEAHQRIYGKCVAVPQLLTKGDQIKYEAGDFRFVDSIEPEVQIGDTVYFTRINLCVSNLLMFPILPTSSLSLSYLLYFTLFFIPPIPHCVHKQHMILYG